MTCAILLFLTIYWYRLSVASAAGGLFVFFDSVRNSFGNGSSGFGTSLDVLCDLVRAGSVVFSNDGFFSNRSGGLFNNFYSLFHDGIGSSFFIGFVTASDEHTRITP